MGELIINVDNMLLRAYGPILWRSSIVRFRTNQIFFDAFPLQSEDSTAAETNELLQKQFNLFVALLQDVDHRVRAIHLQGFVCVGRGGSNPFPAFSF
jgi:hypothetical protein